MNHWLIYLSTIFFTFYLNAQNIVIQKEEWRDALIERMDEEQNEQDINNLMEQLSELISCPISVNQTTREELEQLPFLSDLQIENLLYYLYVFGEMKSIHELRLVDGFDLETIDLVSPFLVIKPIDKPADRGMDNLFKRMYHEVLIRSNRTIHEKEGYVDKCDSILKDNPNKQYLGDPFYFSVRYRMEVKNKLKAGFVLEKDPGEKGVDHYSFFFQLKNSGKLKNLIVGNYKARFGAGLVMNNLFSLGKNQMGADLVGRNPGFSAHGSVDEYNYLQGVGAEIKIGRWLIAPFWSYRKIDALIKKDTILSVKRDGMHALFRDKEKKNKANIISGGIHGTYVGSFYQIGFTGIYHVFDKVYYPEYFLYNRYYWRGKRNGAFSLDYRFRRFGFTFSGETAVSTEKKVATVNSLTFSPSADFSFSVIQRFYDKRYQVWSAKSYGESTLVNDESGVSLYFRFKPIAFLEINSGVDIFRFFWLKYGIDRPSSGYETFCQITYQQQDKWRLQLRYKLKQKDKNRNADADTLPRIDCYQRHQAGINLLASLSDQFFFKTMFEAVFYHFSEQSLSRGFLLSQAAGYKHPRFPLQVDLGFALFDTDDTASKVYLSEKNILYGFGIPSFYGNGMRCSCTLRYNPWERITCWLKVAHTHYFDRDEIGSGLEKIDGQNKTDLWLQLQLKF